MRQVRFGALAIASLVAVGPGVVPAHAVDIRDVNNGSLYQVQLTRAYAPCLAPNDQTTDGIPACSPPVTSPCGFGAAAVSVKASAKEPLAKVRAKIAKLTGPASCTSGVYTLRFTLRATADDPACAGGSCSFRDVTVSKTFDSVSNTRSTDTSFSLAEILPADFPNANLEILGATIADPNGVALATSGLGGAAKARQGKVNLTVADARCESPDTAGVLGPACAPPFRAGSCDFASATLAWKASKTGVLFTPTVGQIVGPATCRNGTYGVRSTMRITSQRCGAGGDVLCTYVDMPVDVPVEAKHGKLKNGADISASGLQGSLDNVELRDVSLVEPDEQVIATSGIGYARRLFRAKLTIEHEKVADPNDDRLLTGFQFPNAAVDPTVGTGATFALRDADGVFYTVTIPAADWQTKRPRHWTYRDDGGAIGGVRVATIKAFRQAGRPGGFKVALVAANVPLAAADRPSVTISATIAASDGSGRVTAERNRVCNLRVHSLSCR